MIMAWDDLLIFSEILCLTMCVSLSVTEDLTKFYMKDDDLLPPPTTPPPTHPYAHTSKPASVHT